MQVLSSPGETESPANQVWYTTQSTRRTPFKRHSSRFSAIAQRLSNTILIRSCCLRDRRFHSSCEIRRRRVWWIASRTSPTVTPSSRVTSMGQSSGKMSHVMWSMGSGGNVACWAKSKSERGSSRFRTGRAFPGGSRRSHKIEEQCPGEMLCCE
jgi:hypothetical protein